MNLSDILVIQLDLLASERLFSKQKWAVPKELHLCSALCTYNECICFIHTPPHYHTSAFSHRYIHEYLQCNNNNEHFPLMLSG